MRYDTPFGRTGKTLKCILAGGLLLLGGALVSAQGISTVGIVNINQVYNSFYRDSQAVRDLERLRQQYQEEIDEHFLELESLKDRHVSAREVGNRRRADQLEEQITELQRFLEDLTRRRRQQLEHRQTQLLSDDFLQRLQNAIQYVAETEGFTLILRSDTEGIQWWSSEIDVSDKVLQRLIRTSR
ncbi:hypothetical protein AU468_14120 [Alkalispirochaeta sphaeroplastigenens]|uniref:Molecular chaperone Skp n=1 Tax=Alkalispirochaeta sphaeroplastigenens TaxID=1187066 RepID=A0A2S4JFE8_9SPIO|nr:MULTISPECIES: OmpH family outer membrane protein [Alkalispirochaeta]POQ98243.1 hypothetical protein AU468_14120 [Alkalispirochaeta sphaeroplastigenens]